MEWTAKELKEFIQERKMTQTELAGLLKVSSSSVSNWTRHGVPAYRRKQLNEVKRYQSPSLIFAPRQGPDLVEALVTCVLAKAAYKWWKKRYQQK